MDGTREKYAGHNERVTNSPRNALFRSTWNLRGNSQAPNPQATNPGELDSREENRIGTVARFYPDPCGIVCAGRCSRRASAASVRTARAASWGRIRMATRLSPL